MRAIRRTLKRRTQPGSTSTPGPCALRAVCLAVGIVFAQNVLSQAKGDSPQFALPKAEGAVKPRADSPAPLRFEETLQHGFFGDLSRPAPPALNRVEGIRIPDAVKPAAGEKSKSPAEAASEIEVRPHPPQESAEASREHETSAGKPAQPPAAPTTPPVTPDLPRN